MIIVGQEGKVGREKRWANRSTDRSGFAGAALQDGSCYENQKQQGAQREDEVGNDACVGEVADDGTGGDFGASGVPHAITHGVVELVEAGGHEAHEGHESQSAVEAPEAELQQFVGPSGLGHDVAHGKEHQGDGEQAVHAK